MSVSETTAVDSFQAHDAPASSNQSSRGVCGICLEVVQKRVGTALISCGSCGGTLHLHCYRQLPSHSTCPLCRQQMDNCQLLASAHRESVSNQYAEDHYRIRIENGIRQGEVLNISLDAGSKLAILAEEIATSLAVTDDPTSMHYDLDVDPSRVVLKVDGMELSGHGVLPAEKRHIVNAEILDRTEGWREGIAKLRASGNNDLADYVEEDLGNRVVEGTTDPWSRSYEYGDIVRSVIALSTTEQTRGSNPAAGSTEEILEVLKEAANLMSATPASVLHALTEEFGPELHLRGAFREK